MPGEAETARGGAWRRGPGRELFDAVAAELGTLPLIAEDLGVITPAVERLRDELGLPGMVVLQFGFDGRPDEPAAAREPPRERRRLHRRPTTTTRPSAGGASLADATSARATGLDGASRLEPDRARARLAAALAIVPRRTCSASATRRE